MFGKAERSQGGAAGLAGRIALPLTLALAGCAARATPTGGVAMYPPAQTETAVSPAPGADPAPESSPEPSQARTFGWLSIALGAEGAIIATATSVAILDYKSTRDSGCNAAKLCSGAGLSANSQIGSLVGWNAGAWVLAAAGLGVGTILILTHPLDKERQTTITLTPTFAPSGTMAGLGLGGSF